jgi:hypothetical protein
MSPSPAEESRGEARPAALGSWLIGIEVMLDISINRDRCAAGRVLPILLPVTQAFLPVTQPFLPVTQAFLPVT